MPENNNNHKSTVELFAAIAFVTLSQTAIYSTHLSYWPLGLTALFAYFCYRQKQKADKVSRLCWLLACAAIYLYHRTHPTTNIWQVISNLCFCMQWYLWLTARRRFFLELSLLLSAFHFLAITSVSNSAWTGAFLITSLSLIAIYLFARRTRKRSHSGLKTTRNPEYHQLKLTMPFVTFAISTLVIATIIFVVIPRSVLPPAASRSRSIGYSEHVDLKKAGNLQIRHNIVARIGVSEPLRTNPLLRGHVFDQYHGGRWLDAFQDWHGTLPRDQDRFRNTIFPPQQATPTDIHVMIERLTTRTLFSIGGTKTITLLDQSGVQVNCGLHGELKTDQSLAAPRQYMVQCWPGLPQPPIHGPAYRHQLRRCLALPQHLSQQQLRIFTTEKLKLRRKSDQTDLQYANALANILTTEFSYSLNLPDARQADPVWHFLTSSRRGHCELFASAFALLLRAQGLPSRLVTGFRLTEWDPVERQYLVRQSHAHAWVEVYCSQYGWVTLDPTPPTTQGTAAPTTQHVEQFWSRHVINFSSFDQRRYWLLAQNFWNDVNQKVATLRNQDSMTLGAVIISLAVFIFILVVTLKARNNKPLTHEPHTVLDAESESTKAIEQLVHELADKHNITKEPFESLTEFRNRLSSDFAINTPLLDVFDSYLAFRFGPEFCPSSQQDQQLADRIHAVSKQVQEFKDFRSKSSSA